MKIIQIIRPILPRKAKVVCRLSSETHLLSIPMLWAFACLLIISAQNALASKSQLSQINIQISELKNSIKSDHTEIKKLERTLWGLDAKIFEAQKQLRRERDERRTRFHEVKREVKRQQFEIEGINKAIALIDQDIELVQRDSLRSQEYFNNLNPLKRQFEEASHQEKLAENQAKVEAFLDEKQTLVESLSNAQLKQNQLKENLISAETSLKDTNLEDDPRFSSLINERKTSGRQITEMRKEVKQTEANLSLLTRKASQLKEQIAIAESKARASEVALATKEIQMTPPAAILQRNYKPQAYVFVISGNGDIDIENILKLKDWVKSYGAHYVQASWDSLNFKEQLKAINQSDKIILIGHGLGGATAIKAATQDAFEADRDIEFLGVIDPIGADNLRANIVYDPTLNCNKPSEKDQLVNSEYMTCLNESRKRIITDNIKHFYNRWQKESPGPADFQRHITAIDNDGNDILFPTATGRFITADAIVEDQKRVFFGNKDKAHQLILEEEARNLPRLLVKYLR